MKSDLPHSAFRISHSRRRGFSLVELLTVIFIIGLLIAILVPSLSTARNRAKKLTTLKELDSLKVGLEMFKGENGAEFPQTNGYPPSFSHPPIRDASREGLTQAEANEGRFPFLNDSKPKVTGAHWLPAMLMGPDQLGYLKRSTVPNKNNLRAEPWKWYGPPDQLPEGKPLLPRGGPYVDLGTPTRKTRDLPGRSSPTQPPPLFPDWDKIQELPVIVDAFDQPILYYVANAHGRTSNMVWGGDRPTDNSYDGSPQEVGPPYYFHKDNEGFTGKGTAEAERGWDFSNTGGKHTIAFSGAEHTALDLLRDEPEYRETFARYIIDRKIYRGLEPPAPAPLPTTPLRPVNADSYLLISAGVDGRYGTSDDVSNLPPWTN